MDGDWRSYALCGGMNPDLFFSEKQRSPDTEKALRICADCPVRRQCLEFAESTASDYGVWGGTTAQRRRPGGVKARGMGDGRRAGRPEHGDRAGAQRHRRRGTPVCTECLAAERDAGRIRKAGTRRSRVAAA